MRLVHLVVLAAVVLPPALAQDNGFQIPVQLLGFPVIIIAVRIANFLKKLTYALNPNTYRARTKRGITGRASPIYDPAEVEKRLIAEMGQGVCIYERVCSAYARQSPSNPNEIDWNDVFRKFASSPNGMGENYLLSIFLGDIVGSAELCHQLSKRGRNCELHFNHPTPVIHPLQPHFHLAPPLS